MRFWGLALLAACLGVLLAPGESVAVSHACAVETFRRDSNAAWSPDRRHIVFSRLHGYECVVGNGLVGDGHWVVEVSDLSGHVRDVFTYKDILTAAWSPDGTRLAIISYSHIWIVNSGNGDVLLERPLNLVIGGTPPTWSPDGRFVGAYNEILDTTTGTITAVGLPIAPPSWSPNNTDAAILANDGLEVVDARNGSRRWLAPGGLSGGSVAWSPLGRWIAYEAGTGLRFVHPDGSDLRSFPEIKGIIVSWRTATLDVSDGQTLRTVTPDGQVVATVKLPRLNTDGGLPSVSGEGHIAYGGTDLCPRIGIFLAPAKRLTNNCIIRGTRRSDRISGTPLVDVILAGAGNDVVRTRDLDTDYVYCGSGRDTAIVDTNDIVHACERVVRRSYP